MLTVHQSVTERLELHEFSGMKIQDIEKKLAEGYQYAVFSYVLSIVFYSFRHTTKRIVKAKSKRALILKSLPYTLLTFFFGWWSLYGVYYTIVTIYTNMTGGIDVSGDIKDFIRNQDPRYQYGRLK
ncbi:MAG: hypothetical protein WCR52_24050 [Bacteroidota bacterium]